MKALTRTLSLVLSFQLAVSCGPGELISSVATPAATAPKVIIEGVISAVTAAVFPTAHAAEGEIIFTDYTDPTNPTELKRISISGTDNFSVEFELETVAGKLIKASFDDTHDDERSRDLIFEVEETATIVSASMNQDKSFEARVYEAKLRQEIAAGLVTPATAKDRFKELKTDGVDDVTEILGDEDLIKMIMNSPKTKESAMEFIAQLSLVDPASSDAIDLKRRLLSLGVDAGLAERDFVFRCLGDSYDFVADGTENLVARFNAVDPEIGYEFRQKFGVDRSFSSSEEGMGMLNDLQTFLREISKKYEKNVSVNVTVQSLNVQNPRSKSCQLFAFSEATSKYPTEAFAEFDTAYLSNINPLVLKDYNYGFSRINNVLFSLLDMDMNFYKYVYEHDDYARRNMLARHNDEAASVMYREGRDLWRAYRYSDPAFEIELTFDFLDNNHLYDAADIEDFRNRLIGAKERTLEALQIKLHGEAIYNETRYAETKEMLEVIYELRMKMAEYYFNN